MNKYIFTFFSIFPFNQLSNLIITYINVYCRVQNYYQNILVLARNLLGTYSKGKSFKLCYVLPAIFNLIFER